MDEPRHCDLPETGDRGRIGLIGEDNAERT